ncbi:hypothetical protein C5467_22740 [Photorhabdus khanii subsp. guanajuatensis]|uniref:Carbonic anhydrase n=1 Tax=Photorhabdus khanii subsp. guanajuatensis TaxID=2100166 RepID=A0A4R4IVI2_9GAMM|nr:hypothetical protein C5467_22740 [Photorhabdus khanii subsp. guanajuatensis]
MKDIIEGFLKFQREAFPKHAELADPARIVNEARNHKNPHDHVESMVRENVIAQLANIQTHPSVRLALEEGRFALHGWIYDIESGCINAYDGATSKFVSLTNNPEVRANPIQLLTAV